MNDSFSSDNIVPVKFIIIFTQKMGSKYDPQSNLLGSFPANYLCFNKEGVLIKCPAVYTLKC